MKLIKEGEFWTSRVKCSRCGSELLINEHDVKCRKFDSEPHYYFTCMICDFKNSVEELLSDDVRERIFDRHQEEKRVITAKI